MALKVDVTEAMRRHFARKLKYGYVIRSEDTGPFWFLAIYPRGTLRSASSWMSDAQFVIRISPDDIIDIVKDHEGFTDDRFRIVGLLADPDILDRIETRMQSYCEVIP